MVIDADLIDSRDGLFRRPQPVRSSGFGAAVARAQATIAGLQIVDTCSYYTDDRGISETVRFGRLPACAIGAPREPEHKH